MNRKSIVVIAICLLLTLGGGGLVYGLVRHEPEFYREAEQAEGSDRHQRAGQFFSDFANFCQKVQDREWNADFYEDCINSYLDDQFVLSGWADKILPEGISGPRVCIQPDKVRLAFRYRCGPISTIISIDMRMWLPHQAPNVVALELQGMHAGSLPIAAQSLLERISEVARQNNIGVTWYRHNGNPVALLRFQADKDRPTIRLDRLVLQKGVLTIRGRSLDEVPLGGMLPFAVAKPAAN